MVGPASSPFATHQREQQSFRLHPLAADCHCISVVDEDLWALVLEQPWSRAAERFLFFGYWAAWFAIGTLLVGVLAAGRLAANAVVIAPRESLSAIVALKWITAALAVAVGVSFIEEIVFREGIILRMFYTAVRLPWLALILSALFFAHVHFKAGGLAKLGTVDWESGWLAAY